MADDKVSLRGAFLATKQSFWRDCFAVFAMTLMLGMPVAQAALPDIEAAVMNKDYEQVKALASGVLKNTKDPSQRMEAEYYFGLAQLRLGQYVEARQAFQNVMAGQASAELYDKAAVGIVEGFYMAGFYKEALVHGEALLKHSPHSLLLSLIYLKIAHADLKLANWTEASSYLNKIIQEFPKSPEAPIAKQFLEEKRYFAVQVGSFLDRARAIALIDELKARGQYAYIVETFTPDGRQFYRVRVGQMSSLQDAQDLETDLGKLGYPTRIYP